MRDGNYTQSDLNFLYARLNNLESQNRTDSGAIQEIKIFGMRLNGRKNI